MYREDKKGLTLLTGLTNTKDLSMSYCSGIIKCNGSIRKHAH